MDLKTAISEESVAVIKSQELAEQTTHQKTNYPLNLLDLYSKDVPHIIKYMGAKKNILEFVIEAINENYNGNKLCDLFSGTNILAGALGKIIPIHSNDIQEYSGILGSTYLSNYTWKNYSDDILNEIVEKAESYANLINRKFPNLSFRYSENMSLEDFVQVEDSQQELIKASFEGIEYHLFTKYYSGTYWSYSQCVWIDSLRKVADDYKKEPVRYAILASLMFAMSYNSQSTGHYAQFRDATSQSSQKDIFIYRQKEILPYFIKKFNQLKNFLGENDLNHTVSALDYSDCLNQIESNSLVYADPPYAFVHYSRFYHALETLVKYDYPKVAHKGRYRTDRHQSPFCKSSEVKNAFSLLFSKIKNKKSNLILSYSNTGMVTLEEILNLASKELSNKYIVNVKEVAYKHSTMGRKNDKNKDVSEYLIVAKQS